MQEFLVELYVPRADRAGAEAAAERALSAAAELTREGTPVRYLRSIFVPEDETCFFLYEAASAEDVERATRRASLRLERAVAVVVEASEAVES
jgi:hypothetical protein